MRYGWPARCARVRELNTMPWKMSVKKQSILCYKVTRNAHSLVVFERHDEISSDELFGKVEDFDQMLVR